MAVSKSLRYEILRRDNFTCRYCGRSAPEVTLEVDHVVPVAHGGSDLPENLVAACRDCNSGKSSSSASSEVVADVIEDQTAWDRAIREAGHLERHAASEVRHFAGTIRSLWDGAFHDVYADTSSAGWHYTSNPDRSYGWRLLAWDPDASADRVLSLHDSEAEALEARSEWIQSNGCPLPTDWNAAVAVWLRAGITEEDASEAVDVTRRRVIDHRVVPRRDAYRYFCGVIWKTIARRQQVARLIIDGQGEHDA